MPMTRAARALLFLPLALLAGCASELPSAESYLEVLPRLVEFAEADARRTQPGQPATGPLFVDLPSIGYGARTVTGASIDTVRLRAAIGRPFVNYPAARADSVLLCDETGTIGGCWVRQYGVYLKLTEARAAGDRMTVLVMSTTTNRAEFPTRICDRTWRVVLERRQGTWALADRQLRRVTCEAGGDTAAAAAAPGPVSAP